MPFSNEPAYYTDITILNAIQNIWLVDWEQVQLQDNMHTQNTTTTTATTEQQWWKNRMECFQLNWDRILWTCILISYLRLINALVHQKYNVFLLLLLLLFHSHESDQSQWLQPMIFSNWIECKRDEQKKNGFKALSLACGLYYYSLPPARPIYLIFFIRPRL